MPLSPALSGPVVGAPGGRTSRSPAQTRRQLSSEKKLEDLREAGADAPVVRVLRNACGHVDVEPLKDADADGALLVAQSDQGIDVCRAARGEIRGGDGDEAENHRAADERDPIGRC